MTPFEPVNGIGAQVSLPLELSAAKLQLVIEDQFFKNSLEKRIMYLHKFENERNKLVDHITEHQMKVKHIFDKRAKPRQFLKNDEVLLWDKMREPMVNLNPFGKALSLFQKWLFQILSG